MDFGGPFHSLPIFLQKKASEVDKPFLFKQFEERETNPLKWVQLWLLPCNFEALAVYQIENDATQLLRRCSLNDWGWTSRSIRSKGVMTACLFCLLLSSLASFCQPGRIFFWVGGREWNLWPKWHRFKNCIKILWDCKKNLVKRCTVKSIKNCMTTHIIRQAVAPWDLFLASDRWWISKAPHPSFCWQGASWISGFIWCLVCRKNAQDGCLDVGSCLMFGIYCPEAWKLENLNLFSNKKEFKWMIASIWIRDSAEVRSFAEKAFIFMLCLVWPTSSFKFPVCC